MEFTKETIIKLMKNKKKLKSMRNNAIKCWDKKITYREDLINSIESLIN